MKKILFAVVFVLAATAVMASTNPLFVSYESARQALLKESVPDVQKAAKQIGAAAHGAGQHGIAAKAADLEKAADLKNARVAFAALSDEVITYRATVGGEKPVVAYCSMEKKSWLQPKGAITNPYVDAGMRACGEVKTQ